MLRRFWALPLLLMISALAAVDTPAPRSRETTLEDRERRAWKALAHNSHFSDVPHISHPRCEDTQPPEALTTPDPLFTSTIHGRKVKVSFIVGTDGRVHSPLILESAGAAGDHTVLRMVRTWRYRPATCNGVPTETEGRVEFSSR
jgi:TonB family protein